MKLIIKWLIATLAIVLTSYLLPGVEIAGFWAAIWVALFLGLINVVIKPILVVLTLPINILTLGLFTFVINALLVLLASSVLEGFSVSGFWIALLFGIIVSIFSSILNSLFKTEE